MNDPRSLRVGDRERDTAAAQLGQHFAAGRLTRLEYDERLSAALTARTGTDLDRLFADLPLLDEQGTSQPHLRIWQGARRLHLLPIAVAFALLAIVAPALHHSSAVAAYPGRAAMAPTLAGPRLIVMVHDAGPWQALPALVIAAVAILLGLAVAHRFRSGRRRTPR